jgi:transcriptional regulator with XRE-family HTH domain
VPKLRHHDDAAVALGKRVRQLRDRKGWTQEQLAEHADIQRTYLAEVELGRRNPSLKHLQKLAKAFRVGIASLFLND